MIVGILKEPPFETRVSLLPEAASQLVKKGISVVVESSAGSASSADDAQYLKSGASISTREEVINQSNIILSIQPPLGSIDKDKILIGVYQPLYHPELVRQWTEMELTVFSLDMLPRTTRAQSMDILSSQANISGYKAVLMAANLYPRYFPMFITAAGSIPPAKVLILGAGVAGLQAIATARRLGAVVEVFDTRAAVKEEVMSLGAKFVEVEGAVEATSAGGYAFEQTQSYLVKQQQRISDSIAKADIVITTAQIPGKKAPLLISEEMLKRMRNGSVIIDLAAATGGNTPVTKNNETISYNGVTIVGQSNLPATMPSDSSKLYGKNIMNFIALITSKENQIHLNWEDDLVKGSCITTKGTVEHAKVKEILI